ncbi:28S ribosomal protein S26, mitochondrial [Tachyglossus aculeatus]|uniref:28S ribosomal protein S26, mitochondrial n=1 Tax=Tachyglossus aculeatus TaxID=9261 RepID=UPI0018F569F6|nr:28S ribosomal protein S26, mitochondrial [Tachyglossus aculeatus]
MAAMLRALGRAGRPGRPTPPVPVPVPVSVPVRGRKSRHDPPTKSKAGLVRTPPSVDASELLVVTERYRLHRLALRALRFEFIEEVRRKVYEEKQGAMAFLRAKQEAEEHQQLMAWNQAENQRLQELREQRLKKEQEELTVRQAQEATQRARATEEFIQEKMKEVLQLQEEAKHFITPENLEQRIEEALDNPCSYHFAVAKDGRVVKRTPLP